MRTHVAEGRSCALRSLGVAIAVVALVTVAGADPETGVVARSGDTLLADIDAPGDVDVFTLPLAAGAGLTVNVKAGKGEALLPTLTLRDPDGVEVAPIKPIKNVGVKPKIKLSKFVVPDGATGSWTVEISGAGDTTGGYAATFKYKQPKKLKVKDLPVPAGSAVVIPFGAESGALVSAKPKSTGEAPLAAVYLVDPEGNEIPDSRDAFAADGRFKKFLLDGGCGDYGLALEGGVAPVTVEDNIKVKWPKHAPRKKVELAPEMTLDAVADGTVRQDDVGTQILVTGASFLVHAPVAAAKKKKKNAPSVDPLANVGMRAVVSGAGVAVTGITRVDATTVALDVAVAADAPFGLRDLTLIPPPLWGEPKTLVDALRVLAPLPQITGTSTPIVKQNEDPATVVVEGTGFRDGASVSIEQPGITLTGIFIDSDTQLTLTMRVGNLAALGPRDVTYTQPAAGGGDTVSAVDLVTVDYPDPVIDMATPDVLRQGETPTVMLMGSGFRDGATVQVGGTGVAVTSASRINDQMFEVQLDLDSDATYGLRDVTMTQPQDGGGASGVGEDVLTVHAPDPVLTSSSPVALTQGDQDVLVTLTGDHLRGGATVTISGTGLTLSDYTRVSDTQATVRISADDDATLGSRSFTYTQPSAGGAATTMLGDALQVNAPTPTASSISVIMVKQLDTGVEVTLTGGEMRSGGTISFSGSGLTVGTTTVDSRTTARVTIDVGEFADVGLRDVTFTQPAIGGSRSSTLTDALRIDHPDPTLSSVTPDQVRRTKAGTMRVFGSAFRDGGTMTTDAAGVTFGTPVVQSPDILDVSYTVGAGAQLIDRDITYTQPAAGGGAMTTLDDAYDVFDAPPSFTSITPDGLRPGDTYVPCVILGGGFLAGTTVSFSGDDVVVEDLTITSATRLDLIISVPSTASLGPADLSVQLSDGGPAEIFDDAFSVRAADPVIHSFSHASLARGADDVEIEILGLEFRSGDTVSASGSGVTFSNVVVQSETRITADVDVTSGAALGTRDLTVTHAASAGGRAGTLDDAFTVVTTGPTVSGIEPTSIARTGSGGRTRVVTAYIDGTSFMGGATVSVARSSGSGVSVVSGSTRVLSDDEIEVQLQITGTATTGTWDVTVTNPGNDGSGSSGDDALSIVSESTLTVNQVVPPLGETYGGDRVVIHGGGFATGAVVDFGTQRAYLAQVIDENTIVCTVPQPTSASRTATTEVDVKVTYPSTSSATRDDGYGYRRDTTTMFGDVQVPAADATNVPATLAVSAVRMSSPCATLPIYSGSSATFPERTMFWSEISGQGVASGAAVLSADRRWIVYTRDTTSPLVVNSTGLYRMYVPGTVSSLAGVPLTEITKTSDGEDVRYDSFNYFVSSGSADATAPSVSSTTPGASATGVSTTAAITVVVSEAMNPLTATSTNVTLKQGGSAIPCHVALSDDLTTLTLSPHAELATSTTYTIGLSTAIQDMHGNAIASAFARTFTTGSGTDTRGPTIDAVIVEGLASDVDGSGTYVAGVDSTGGSTNPQAASPGASTAFDLFVPRSGFELRVEFSDEGGAGIDPTSFSAKCSVAVGQSAANAELASSFDVTPVRAVWRVPSTSPVATGENVTFTFTVDDMSGNSASSSVITVDVGTLSATSQSTTGGNLDPFESRQTWVLRGDLDAYSSTYFQETLGSLTFPRMTTTNSGNDVNDLDEALRLVGLWSPSMTVDAAATANGPSRGTNQIMRRLVLERIREIVRERFGIDADGSRDDHAPEIEFLLPGELGSLSALPAYSSSSSTASSNTYSEICIGGTQGPESNGASTSGVFSASAYDVRNLQQEALINTDGTYGVFVSSFFKSRLPDGRYTQTGSQSWRGMVRLFGRYVLEDFEPVWGGTPVGEHASDDDVLAELFDRTTSSSTTHNDRYDAIFTAIETVALIVSCQVSEEIGLCTGLLPDGAPKTGLFGHAHRNNTFTDASTSALNVTHRIYWNGVNNLLAPDGTLFEKIRTGSDHRRFNPLAMAWLRQRLLYDEGQ